MKTIKVDLAKDLDEIEIHIFADEHIGDPGCDMKYLQERIEYVKNTPNAYCILGGDLMDNATKTSIGDTYTQTMSPMEQIDYITNLFKPIKKKILCAVLGNHEMRTYKKEGIDPMRCVCDRLGCAERYSNTGALVFVRFGEDGKHRKLCYTLYTTHGAGGGRKEGAKAIRLADMASIVDADVYCHHHTHLPMIMKQDYYRTSLSNSSVSKVTKLFVNGSSNLDYGGYGETQGYKPSSKDKPKIILNGKIKNTKAIL